MRSVATKIFLAFAVALVAFGLVAAFGVSRLDALRRDLRLLSEGYLPLTRIAAQIDVKDWMTSRVLEADALGPAARRAWLPVARAQFPAVVREKIGEARGVVAGARAIAGPADQGFLLEVGERLDALDARWAQYDAAVRSLFEALEEGQAEGFEQRLQAVRSLERDLSLKVKLLQAALDGQVADRVHAAERTESRTVWLVLIYSLLAAAVGVGAAVIGQRLLAPIRTLTEGVKAVAGGDLTRKVEVRSDDEIGLLAREFNAMAASLDRQRAELRSAERLAAVGRISAQITHEIRNPLNAIGLNAELLAEELEPSGSQEARALAAAIEREVDRLNGVAEEYLRFARLPRPVFALEDVNEVLAGLAEFLGPELARAGVAVHLDLAADVPPVRADEGQLRAVFLNLVRNSREAMPRGGTLSLRTRIAEGFVQAEVQDTGGGIPAEDLPRIFDPFYSTKEKGTGLGLAFVLQVMQEHGGSVRCESRPGQGTVFTLRLPAAQEDRAGARRALSA